ncbi:uncharacterized protein LOC129773808 [Toxorhynchites rutilus septentrionalis]|uniref:uncharacterized protein LOC129773808 n=1 Tax=Toxorhynchites rutilus septentrionalis TaxID=329112 RepID=UPI002478EDC8|nr:uncharacterized protein LOC129773808 [Toxorhynchites rutilus septentrionalis]
MSERLCQILKLKRRVVNIPICGVGQSESRAKHSVNAVISSRTSDYSMEMRFLILQRLTSELPVVNVPVSHWKIPTDLQLADPGFNNCGKIVLIIGAEHFFSFLYERKRKRILLGPELPLLIDTVFGWIVTGKVADARNHSINCYVAATTDNLEGVLEKFWKIDSMEDHHPWSKEEQDCEAHFVHTHERAEDGRYIVRLPRHVSFDWMVGESESMALNRFRKLEQKLGKNQVIKEQYHSFMREYLAMGHMRKVSVEDTSTAKFGTAERKAYYLPHHAVLKHASTTTKLRVVFDGSACTDSGYSLNDALMKGPILQDELLTLLLRFRKHQVALVGDIEKMYRQVRIHNEDTVFQRIFWRFSVEDPIEIYELLTVTYALTPSSFLATRVIKQLAIDEIGNHPEACAALERDMYVDDYIGGAASVESACYLRKEMDILTSKSGFPLRKWCSNRAEVLVGIPIDQLGTSLTISFDLDPEERIKALGITWEPESDQLRFVYNIDGSESAWTRRRILSAIARLFVPFDSIDFTGGNNRKNDHAGVGITANELG